MLGSRFELSEVLADLAKRPEPATREPVSVADASRVEEESCVELEREMAAVARTIHGARTRVIFRCPVCDDDMQVRDESKLSEFGGLDVQLHRLECGTCGMLAGRVYHPSVGYRCDLVR